MTRKLLVAAVALTTLFGVTPAANAAAQLKATFSQASVWDSGYGGRYNIKNTGDTASTSWVIEFDLPSGTTITSSWSSNETRTGQHYKFTNTATNGKIAPGDSKGWGFNADGLGTPLNCTINGAACGTPPPTDTQAPTVPTGLQATAVTASSVSLSWTASTDNVGVTDYQVFQGTSVVDTVSTTSSTVTGLAASTSYTFTVKARDAAGNA
ncbi:cellulose binding domain-containing protein, partial [Kibdelosporangium lantanae]